MLEQEQQTETLRYWEGNQQGQAQALAIGPAQIASISEQGKQLFAQQADAVAKTAKEELGIELSEEDKRKIELIQDMIEMLTGKKIRFVLPRLPMRDARAEPGSLKLLQPLGQAVQGRILQGWGLDYQYHHVRYEQETMNFSAAGIVKTADGREINFSAQLSMSRQFMEEQRISIRAGDALIDPLVINFDSPAARLTDKKYSFNIDSDGDTDQISFAGPGSGFLTLDVNGDGQVSNGKELFGPNTGNGFAELAKYDLDGNDWIDENDAIYDKLRIWTKDANGNDQLFALGQFKQAITFTGPDFPGSFLCHLSIIRQYCQIIFVDMVKIYN